MTGRGTVVIVAWLALTLPSAASGEETRGPGARCSFIEPCAEGLVCSEGRCRELPDRAPPQPEGEATGGRDGERCDDASPCRDGLICMEGVCRGERPAGTGSAEGEDETEEPRSRGPGDPCSEPDQCGEGLACIDGACQIYAPTLIDEEVLHPEEGRLVVEREPEWETYCHETGECPAGRACVDGVCVEGSRRPVEVAPPPDEGAASRGEAGRGGDRRQQRDDARREPSAWERFTLDGIHGLVGLSLGAGLSGYWHTDYGFEAAPSFVFGLRGGVTIGRAEVALEVVPYTLLVTFDGDNALGLTATGGWLAPLTRHLSWPLRAGVGVTVGSHAVLEETSFPALQLRAELVGLVFQHGHLLLEVALPSIRYHPQWSGERLWTDVETNPTVCVGRQGCGAIAPPDGGVWIFLLLLSASYVI